MPKLIAGIFFAILGYFCADQVRTVLPEGQQIGWLYPIMALIGAYAGWFMSGQRSGDGVYAGLGYGLTSSALIVFWGVLVFSGYKMLQNSIQRRYDGPMDALQDMVTIGAGYIQMIAVAEVIWPLVVGGVFGGWLTEWVARRWS